MLAVSMVNGFAKRLDWILTAGANAAEGDAGMPEHFTLFLKTMPFSNAIRMHLVAWGHHGDLFGSLSLRLDQAGGT
ncbi:MAG: hypothetical protein O7C63_03240 [Alphaproteobacteria bacterium]|nr:hypothetical protein [Alphaproteobacteria bacterium]